MAEGSNTSVKQVDSTSASTPDVVWDCGFLRAEIVQVVINAFGDADTITLGIIPSRQTAVSPGEELFSSIPIRKGNPFSHLMDRVIEQGYKLVAYGAIGGVVTVQVSYKTL